MTAAVGRDGRSDVSQTQQDQLGVNVRAVSLFGTADRATKRYPTSSVCSGAAGLVPVPLLTMVKDLLLYTDMFND